MRNDEPLALLARENPVSESDLPDPGSAEARALLARVVADDGVERGLPAGGRRRVPRAVVRGAVALAAAGAAALAVLGTLPGDDVIPGDGPQTASAIERTAAVLADAKGEILHTVARSTRSDEPGKVQRTETWEQLSPPYDTRRVEGRGDVTRELATVDGRPQIYLSSNNTISTLPPDVEVPPERERNLRPFLDLSDGLADFRESLLRLLRSGDARVDGRLPVDGREAIRIVSRLKTTLLVDAGSFEPIEWRQVFDGGIVVTTRFEAYERIAATKANKALLSVRAQHPDAKIDHGISIDPDPPGKRPTRAEAGERE